MAGVRPTKAFARAKLELAAVPSGERYGRIFFSSYPDPLGFGKSPSRFSDPRRRTPANRFGVLYLGSSLKVCFVEAVLRDRRDGIPDDLPIDESELHARHYAEVDVHEPLCLVDLRGDAPLRMGVPSDVVGGSGQTLARAWSLAFHEHPQKPDGIIYPSRLNEETNLAIYGRAVGKLQSASSSPLVGAPHLAAVLDTLKIALI